MVELANALSVGLVLTAAFALRFGYWRRPLVLVAYFSLFFVAEWVAVHFFIPPGAMGMEITWVCLTLTPPIVLATYVMHRYGDDPESSD